MTLDDVPLTRLAGTAQERVAPDPAPVADALAKYAETDLLCYRAEHPLPLVVRQARELAALARLAGADPRRPAAPTEGVIHVPQDPEAVAAVRHALAEQPPEILAALGIAIPALGSAALGLALAEGALDPQRAHELASLDELFQVEQWGEDEWALRRRTHVAEDIALAARFIELPAPHDRQAAAHRGPGPRGRLPGLDGPQATKLGVAGWVRNRARRHSGGAGAWRARGGGGAAPVLPARSGHGRRRADPRGPGRARAASGLPQRADRFLSGLDLIR